MDNYMFRPVLAIFRFLRGTYVSAATHTDSNPPGDKTGKKGNTIIPGA